jgi:hypothetical protein
VARAIEDSLYKIRILAKDNWHEDSYNKVWDLSANNRRSKIVL